MIRYGKETAFSAQEVIERAVQFFGMNGEGLSLGKRDDCCVRFEGGGGYIFVQVVEGEGKSLVDVESREWDHQAREFLEHL